MELCDPPRLSSLRGGLFQLGVGLVSFVELILVRKNFDQISASSGLTTEFNQFVRIQGPLRVGVANSYLILALHLAAHHPHDYVPLGESSSKVAANSVQSSWGSMSYSHSPSTSEDLVVDIIVCLVVFLRGANVHYVPPRFKSST